MDGRPVTDVMLGGEECQRHEERRERRIERNVLNVRTRNNYLFLFFITAFNYALKCNTTPTSL